MGEPTIWSLSADVETEQIVARWQREFSPLVGSNRSRLVCMALKTLDRLGFTAERLIEALNAPQRLRLENDQQALANLNNSSQSGSPAPSFPALEGRAKKPPVRVQVKVGANRGQDSHIRSGRTAKAKVPSGITFFPKHLRLNSTRIDGRAA